MRLNVSDGLTRVQTTGQKVWKRVGPLATGIRGEVGSAAHGLREEIDGVRHHGGQAARKRWPRGLRKQRKQSGWAARVVKLAGSLGGAATAFFISRLVRSRQDRPGR